MKDKKTAEGLKPWYRQLCKRPCFHDEYLEAYNNPNAHLIDTGGKGVERIDATGAWVGGVHYDLDLLIYASGFEVGTATARRAGYETVGRNGITLSDTWTEGMQSMHGLHVHGFPNLFIIGVTHAANLISNITHNLTEAGSTIASVIAHASKVGATEVEVTKAAEQAWVAQLDNRLVAFLGNAECTPGYYNNEGLPIGRREELNSGGYAAGAVAYFHHIDAWRRSGKFEGLEFRTDRVGGQLPP